MPATAQIIDITGNITGQLSVGADELLLIGAAPGLDTLGERGAVRELARSRRVRTLLVRAVTERHLSRNHLAVWMQDGKLRAATLHPNRVRLQAFGAARRVTPLSAMPGEVLPAAVTLWLPSSTANGKPMYRRVAIINPDGFRSRSRQLAADIPLSPNTTAEQTPPDLTPRRLDALVERYPRFLRFPAREEMPWPTPVTGDANEAVKDTVKAAARWLGMPLRARDQSFLAHLLEGEVLHLEDLVERHACTSDQRLEDVVALFGHLSDEGGDRVAG